MALPRKFMAARMTNSTLGSVIDNNSADTVDLGGLGSIESAICDIFGFTIDSNISATALGMTNSGTLTKAQIIQSAAGPTGWRFRDTTTGTEMRMVIEGSVFKFDQNTTYDVDPTVTNWVTRFSINVSTGVLSGEGFSDTHAGLAPASDLSAVKYLSAAGTYSTPSGSATATSCRLSHSINQSIPNATSTAISFNTENWDTNGMHAGGAPTRITFPVTGKYLVIGVASFDTNATGKRMLDIVYNGSSILSRSDVDALAVGGTWVHVSTMVNATATTDYVELKAYQTSGGALNVVAGTLNSPVFSAYRIGG